MTETKTIATIHVDPDNVRADDESNVEELAKSILSTGLIQPIVLDMNNQVIAGHRRTAAIRYLIREGSVPENYEFPVVYRDAEGDVSSLQMMLVENLQREDLDPIEEAAGYERMVETYGFKQSEIAQRVGKSGRVISRRLKLLELPDKAKYALSRGDIVLEQAEAFFPIIGNVEIIEEMLTLKLNAGAIKSAVEKVLRLQEIDKYVAIVDHYGGVGVSEVSALHKNGLEVHTDGKSLVNPTEQEIQSYVEDSEIYMVTVTFGGEVTIQPTKKTAVGKKGTNHTEHEKVKRAAKRMRQDVVGELIIHSGLKAADVRPLLNCMIANLLGNQPARLACTYLGITKEQVETNEYGDPRWDDAIAKALNSNGVLGIRAQVAVVAAFWELRHGAHVAHLDPNYAVLLEMLGVELDPKTLGPVNQETDDE